MTMAPRSNAQSISAELSLVRLKNCLVNLPPTLVSLLVNADTVSWTLRILFSQGILTIDS